MSEIPFSFIVESRDFPEFTKLDIEAFASIFQKYDADNSGTIDSTELAKMFKDLGQGNAAPVLFGELTFSNFLALQREFYPEKVREYRRLFLDVGSKFTEYSRGEIEALALAFRAIDDDGSGTISISEFPELLDAMGQGRCFSDEEMLSLMGEFDLDGSGELDFGEFLGFCRYLFPQKRIDCENNFMKPALREFPEFTRSEIEVFLRTFREFDVDDSNTIDGAELLVALHRMGECASIEKVAELLQKFDTNHSGEIDWLEWVAMQRDFYPFADRALEITYFEPAMKVVPEFTRDEIKEFIFVFRDFDVDGDGTIDTNELEAFFKYIGQPISEARVAELLEEFDSDKSGVIEWSEFLMIMRSFYPDRMREFQRDFFLPARDFPEFTKAEIMGFVLAFREFDVDGGGSIDTSELGVALKKLGIPNTPANVQKIIDQFDTDGSGEIEWVEFLEMMRTVNPSVTERFQKEFLDAAKAFPEFDESAITAFIRAFREFDVDGSGSIDTQELKAMFKAMGQGITDKKLSEYVRAVDTDLSGEIEWTEFLELMKMVYGSGSPATATAAASSAVSGTSSTVFKEADAPKQRSAAVATGFGAKKKAGDTCVRCDKPCYQVGTIKTSGMCFHSGCFKCAVCKASLTLANHIVHEGDVYCKVHKPKASATPRTGNVFAN